MTASPLLEVRQGENLSSRQTGGSFTPPVSLL